MGLVDLVETFMLVCFSLNLVNLTLPNNQNKQAVMRKKNLNFDENLSFVTNAVANKTRPPLTRGATLHCDDTWLGVGWRLDPWGGDLFSDQF